jgi:hypothetical protein
MALWHACDARLLLAAQRPEYDDLDQEVVDEIVASYHFGGA